MQTNYAGGLIGYADGGSVTNSYTSATIIDQNDRIGQGLIGYVNTSATTPTITNSYYNEDTTTSSYNGIGKTDTEFKNGTTSTDIYTNWSTDIWAFGTNEDHPTLGLEGGSEIASPPLPPPPPGAVTNLATTSVSHDEISVS